VSLRTDVEAEVPHTHPKHDAGVPLPTTSFVAGVQSAPANSLNNCKMKPQLA
jgi:hypothetical protein